MVLMTSSVLLELLRHKTWATLEVIELCQRLAPEVLDASLPGTYGSIRDTLRHLLRSDAGYFFTVTGENTGAPEDAGLGALADSFKQRAGRWEALFQDPTVTDKDVSTRWGTCKALAPMAQSIHHADDHRTQVLSILGAQGIEVPDLDVWEWGSRSGYVHAAATANA